MVMSLGWNPFYKNEKLTAVSYHHHTFHLKCFFGFKHACPQEIHIMHEYKHDFYGYELRAIVLGYIRPELDYTSRGEQNPS
jgi:riboflavin kinase